MEAKVLIVDDSLVARLSLRNSIKDRQVELKEASSGEAALDLVAAGWQPEVIFLDLTMPGIGGLETLARLRVLLPSARIIVVTADVQTATLEEVRSRGAFDIIRKPADTDLVCGALDRARAER
jgi:two-component system chemotaxis response regulator CheY